jgi:hypothetical protein
MPSKYRPKRPMRVERLATPRPEFLSPMLWKRENPSHLRPDHLRVGRSIVCRVVLANHLAARVCARRCLELVITNSPARGRRRDDKSNQRPGGTPFVAEKGIRNYPVRIDFKDSRSSIMKSKNADIRGVRLRSGCVSRRQLRNSSGIGPSTRTRSGSASPSAVGSGPSPTPDGGGLAVRAGGDRALLR